jgi:hypothetical protein
MGETKGEKQGHHPLALALPLPLFVPPSSPPCGTLGKNKNLWKNRPMRPHQDKAIIPLLLLFPSLPLNWRAKPAGKKMVNNVRKIDQWVNGARARGRPWLKQQGEGGEQNPQKGVR